MKYTAFALIAATALSSAAVAAERLPSVMTGGVGDENLAMMRSVEDRYNTKLVFTGDKGMYLADVKLIIRDRNGNEVVRMNSDGPVVLAELQPGKYTVEANAEGYRENRDIQVSDSLKTYHIRFPVKGGMKPMQQVMHKGYEVTMHFPG